jgi:teichuronic acid biosynthesis glycosyltransferase TuaH
VFFVTDDWLEGSELIGVPQQELRRVLQLNLARADAVAAVSDSLLVRLGELLPDSPDSSSEGPAFEVLPNGCAQFSPAPPFLKRGPTACLVGQLNERLDIGVLEALQASGVPLVVIGPRTDRDPVFGRRLDSLLAAEGVDWLGRLETDEVQQQLGLAGVGITPYADTPFNRASFPLKTLEYLSAGLAVVSTETPSARWLNTDLISLSPTPEDFVSSVIRALASRDNKDMDKLRRDFASRHSWAARATQFQQMLAR